MIVMLFLPETKKVEDRHKLNVSHVINTYIGLFKHRIYFASTIIALVTYGSYFSWLVASPVLLMHHIGMSATGFGWLQFFIAIITFFIGGRLNARYVTRFGTSRLIQFGLTIAFAAGVFLLISALTIGLNLVCLVISAVILFFGNSFIFSNVFAEAFTPVGHVAGFASSMYAFMQTVGGFLLGALVSHVPEKNSLPLALIFCLVPIVAMLIYRLIILPELKLVSDDEIG